MQKSVKFIPPRLWIYPLVSVILFSCTQNRRDSLNTQPKIEYKSFVGELDSLRINGCTAEDIVALKKKHYKRETEYKDLLSNGLTRLHGELNAFNDSLAATFEVYDYLSQFSNYSTFTDEQMVMENGKKRKKYILAYSKEMFLNDTFPVYSQLDLPSFFTKYCATNQIAYQLVMGYLKMRYEPDYVRKSMLDEAVFQGKIWHSALEAFPNKKPWEIIGYTEKEWQWLESQEGQIWKHFIDNKLLFTTRFQDYKRYFAYGLKTFGGGVPEDCPPLIGNYIGLRIVQAWVKEQGDYNLYNLWKIKDANTLLQQSTYNPIK